MRPCECSECDYPCEQYAEPRESVCYECENDEHMQDRNDE